jgi:C4-dicarboxylate transporter, DctQ subunit
MMRRWKKWDEAIGRLEQALVTVMLGGMILVAFLQVLLRNALSTGVSWGDPLVRSLVLWVGFVGAAMATREGKHISMDVLSRFARGRWSCIVPAVNHLVSCLICAWLTLAAGKFIGNEAQAGAVSAFGVPGWVPEIIIPAIFALMAVRFGLRGVQELLALAESGPNGPGTGEP